MRYLNKCWLLLTPADNSFLPLLTVADCYEIAADLKFVSDATDVVYGENFNVVEKFQIKHKNSIFLHEIIHFGGKIVKFIKRKV